MAAAANHRMKLTSSAIRCRAPTGARTSARRLAATSLGPQLMRGRQPAPRGRLAVIHLVTRIHAPPTRCFDLARSIDFHVVSTLATRETAIAGVTSGLIGQGEQVTWRARHFGLWLQLTSAITAWKPPHSFRDSQLEGPFRRMDHDHHFEPWEARPGWTLATDLFQFEAPGGPCGQLAEQAFLTRYLTRFLERRAARMKAALESDEWSQFLPHHTADGAG